MAVTYSSGVITVTGTETSLANFTGLTGVTTTALGNKTLYVLDTSRLVVTGSLIIDPDVECLYLKANVAYPCITYNGTLQIGRKRTSGSRILYSTGDAIIIGRQAANDFDTVTYAGICSTANGSAFIGYGGSIKTKSPVSFGGTLNTKYTGSVNIESLDFFQGAAANAAAAQVRFDLSSGQTINVKGLRLSCDTDNVTLRNVLLFATNFTSFAAQFAAFTLQNFSSSSVDLTFDNLEFSNNYVSYDIFGNSAYNVAITPIYTLRNTDVGTATRAWGNTDAAGAIRMNWLFTQTLNATLLDAAGTPISGDAGLFLTETDDGNRFQPEQGRSGFTWTTVESYSPTPNGSGIATATVRTGIKKWYGLASPLTTTISQSYFGKSSADDFDIYFFGYLYLSNVRTEILRGTGGTSFNWAQLSDSYITQTNRTTVNAYTEISNLDRLYDRYKSWFVSNFSTAYPSIGQQKINGNGDTLDLSNANLVVDGTAASAFAINVGTNTITIKASMLSAGSNFKKLSTSGSVSFVNGAAPSSSLIYTDALGTSVVISAPNLWEDYRVQVYDITNATEIDNSVVSGGLGYNYRTIWDSDAQIRLRATYCVGISATNEIEALANFTNVGASFLNSPELNDVYVNNAIDGSTVTEFIADYPNVEIDVSDPDGVTTPQRIHAWYHYIITTEDGISDLFGAILDKDLFNYEIDQDVVDLKFDNITASPVKIAGAYLFRKDGSTIIADGSGSIQVDPGKAYISDGSTILLELNTIKKRTALIAATL